MKKTLLACAILSATSLNALAAEKDLYVKVDAGAAFPLKYTTANYGKKKADTSAMFGIGLGKEFGYGMSADLSFYRFDQFKFSKTITSLSNSKVDQDISSNLLTLNANYNLPKYSVISPFVTAGFGIASNETSDYVQITPGSGTSTRFGKTTYNYAWNVGLGTEIDTGTPVDLTLGYKYFDLGQAKTHSVAFTSAGTITTNRSVIKTDLKAHAVMAGIKYKF